MIWNFFFIRYEMYLSDLVHWLVMLVVSLDLVWWVTTKYYQTIGRYIIYSYEERYNIVKMQFYEDHKKI